MVIVLQELIPLLGQMHAQVVPLACSSRVLVPQLAVFVLLECFNRSQALHLASTAEVVIIQHPWVRYRLRRVLFVSQGHMRWPVRVFVYFASPEPISPALVRPAVSSARLRIIPLRVRALVQVVHRVRTSPASVLRAAGTVQREPMRFLRLLAARIAQWVPSKSIPDFQVVLHARRVPL